MVILWLLFGASIYISKKIDWKPLGTLAFLVSALVLEWVVWDVADELSVPIFTLVFHAFAYLFIYNALFEGKTPRFRLVQEEVFVLAVSISLLLLNLFLIYKSQGAMTALGIVYLCNAVIWLVGYATFRTQLPKRMYLLFFVLAGTFIGLAIPALMGQELMGLFWALEGIGLVACGFIFAIDAVRKEGYLIMLIAFGKIALTFPEIVQNWGENIWHFGFMNFLALGVIMLIVRSLLYKFRLERSNYEGVIAKVLSESLSVWAWGVWLMLSWQYLGISTYNFALISMLLLAWWGNKQQLKFTEWFGLANFAFFFFGLGLSVAEVDSLRFTEQTVLGKISMLEIFLPLWGLQLFYEKLMPNSRNIKLMQICREVFYIALPWVWLRGFSRHFPEYMMLAFWASSAMSFGLSELLRNKKWVFGKSIPKESRIFELCTCGITLPELERDN